MMTMMTTTELAAELDTTPRTLRKFLRDDFAARDAATPGKGARYAIPRRELRSLRPRFAQWVEARDAAKTDDQD